MGEKKEQQLKELGSKLETLPSSKDSLLKLLKQAALCLSEVDQLPPANVLESMQPLLKAIVKPELLDHQDKDVKLLVASCICEITRITAPEAPYSDDVLKDVFRLIVGTFSGLRETSGPSFARRVVILETVAKYRSCVVMLDLECDDLVNEMFSNFLAVASDDHPDSVLSSMQTIMEVVLEESEDVRKDLLLILLSALGRDKTGVSMAARRLSMNVIKNCAGKLEPGIKQFLVSSLSGDNHSMNGQIDYHDVIYDIYRCAPQILVGLAPYITGELLTDQLDTRLKAVRLLGDIFSLPESSISEAFQPIFSEFLKRLADRVVAVRMSVLEHIKSCLLSDPLRPEASLIISALCDRLLDYDESVRKQVVAVIGDVACHSPYSIPVETVKLVAERLRDKSVSVKRYTMERLADIYRNHCGTCANGSLNLKAFDWIPGKILRCLYDKDFRSDTIESVLCGSLFPTEFSIKDKAKTWIRIFSELDKVEVKALEKILEQKQRLQLEMQRYLSLRQMNQNGDAPETQKKILFCFRIMSRSFGDPLKAEENFQSLDQLKDTNIWKILTNLVDPSTSFDQACTLRDDLLRILGEKHRLYEFLSTLSLKCSYILFNKEHVKEILLEVATQRSAGNTQYILSCMNVLVVLARFCPMLLKGTAEELVSFLKDDNELIKEGVLHILAKAGGTIRDQLADLSSSVDLILERLCLEGNRRQAKFAVHALAAITKDDGLKSLSILYKRLVDMLEEKTHLPAVLQSLGCIAQTAMPVFETRESEIKEFIKRKILNSNDKVEGNAKLSWDDRSELCLLKIYGIKTLVKSYLPVNDAHLRPDIDGLIEILRNIQTVGEISKDIESSLVDKAHLKLASAKAILRLSRHWENKIPVDVFHLTLRTVEIGFPQAKKLFLAKVHQYIKDRLLDPKYACAFIFSLPQPKNPEFNEEKQNLLDIIQMLQQAKARQHSVQSDANAWTNYPEFILPYLIHAIAHHSCPDIDDCKDITAYEQVYRQLYFALSMLIQKDEDVKSETTAHRDSISTMAAILLGIKSSEDVVDGAKSKNSHALCDIGLSIVKHLAQKENELQGQTTPVSLPLTLYRPYETKEGDESAVEKGQTWLADQSILSHFESLKVDVDGMVHSETPEEKAMKDGERDGNEVPLGKMMKHLKSQGSKGKKVKKSKADSAEVKKTENDVDIMKMVRDINLDNLGMSTKNESSNGHKHFPSKKTTDSDDQENRKRHASEVTTFSIPKRRRSLSVHSASRSANKASARGNRKERSSEIGAELEEQVPMQKNKASDTKSAREGKGSSQGYNGETDEDGEDKGSDVEKSNIQRKTEKSPSKSAKKRKRRSVAGLAKCTMKEDGGQNEELVGRRIKVWWPMDKQYYEGTIKSYDPIKRKHVVLYDDGDVEVLRLGKERWELIDGGRKPTKQSKSSKASSPGGRSSGKRGKVSAGSRQSKKSAKKSEEGDTPRKYQKRGQKGASKGKRIVAKDKESSDLSNPELATKSEDNELNSDSKQNHSERMGESSTDAETESEVKLVSEEKQPEENEGQSKESGEDNEQESHEDVNSPAQDVEESDEEEVSKDESEGVSEEEVSKDDISDSEEDKKAHDTVHDSKRKKRRQTKSSTQLNSSDPEISDDEPLVKWKSRAGKLGAKRAR